MSAPEITPELLRAVADWYLIKKFSSAIASNLHTHADRLEREQADEQRIDEYARVSYAAEIEAARGHVRGRQVESWDEASDIQKNVSRAGIRAVLAKLDEEREPKFNKGGIVPKPVRQWDNLRNVPDDVRAVFTPHGNAHRDGSAPNGWRWDNGGNVTAVGLTSHTHYIEIVGGYQ